MRQLWPKQAQIPSHSNSCHEVNIFWVLWNSVLPAILSQNLAKRARWPYPEIEVKSSHEKNKKWTQLFWRSGKSTEMIICKSGCSHKINFLSKKTSRFPRQLRPRGRVTHRRPSRHRHTHLSQCIQNRLHWKSEQFSSQSKIFLQAEVWTGQKLRMYWFLI